MYNKSEILKRAWSVFKYDKANRRGRSRLYSSFSSALKESWDMAKHAIKVETEARANGKVKATELKVGDVVAFDGFGGYEDVSFTRAIISIKSLEISGKQFVTLEFENYNANACIEVDKFVKLAATPMAESYAA